MKRIDYFIIIIKKKDATQWIDEVNHGLEMRERTVEDVISIVKMAEDTLYVFYKREK